MSRVERHKDEYSKEDRQALESKSTASRPAAAAERSAGGRSKGRKPEQDENLGVWDQTEEEKRQARKEARAMNDGKPEFHAGKALGKFLNFVGTLILILAILACLGLTVPRFAGIDQYVVISGSMEPAIPVGSMVYCAQTDPSTLSGGDIIVFYANETGSTPVTHRVVENHVADGELITKGDANAQNDLSPIIYANVIGKLVLHIPMLGYIAAPMGSLLGKVAMGCVILAAYLLTMIGSRLSGK